MMNKIKVLQISVIGLTFLNLFLLWFVWSHRPIHKEPKNEIIRKLNLDEGQKVVYKKFIDWHRAEVNKYQDSIYLLKSQLYTLLIDKDKIAIKDSLLREIAKINIKLEEINFKHFEDIQSLCRNDQIESFRQLSFELQDVFHMKNKLKHRDDKRNER